MFNLLRFSLSLTSLLQEKVQTWLWHVRFLVLSGRHHLCDGFLRTLGFQQAKAWNSMPSMSTVSWYRFCTFKTFPRKTVDCISAMLPTIEVQPVITSLSLWMKKVYLHIYSRAGGITDKSWEFQVIDHWCLRCLPITLLIMIRSIV